MARSRQVEGAESEPNPSVTIYRCARCGKWSHARRKPKHHERYTALAEPDERVLESSDPVYGIYDGEVYEARAGGDKVACGPFETWLAVRHD